jgi:hypothetical protein
MYQAGIKQIQLYENSDEMLQVIPFFNMWPFRLFILASGIIDIFHLTNNL